MCLLSLSSHDMLFLFALLTRSTQFLYALSFSWRLLQSEVVHKLLCQWTKSDFHVSINFSHGEVTKGSENYLRRRDTCINTFEHMLKSPYVWCVTVQRLLGTVTLHWDSLWYKVLFGTVTIQYIRHQIGNLLFHTINFTSGIWYFIQYPSIRKLVISCKRHLFRNLLVTSLRLHRNTDRNRNFFVDTTRTWVYVESQENIYR